MNSPRDHHVWQKKLHYSAGVLLAVFVFSHLLNHLLALLGPEAHIEAMQVLRKFYRNPIIESLLLLGVFIQVISGLTLGFRQLRLKPDRWRLLQVVSGFYLALFLMIHVAAVIAGRIVLNLDTNVYFAMAGLNTPGYQLFFIPYYALAILAFFGHVAVIHQAKMKYRALGLSPRSQSLLILCTGAICSALILWGMTNGFQWAPFPRQYNMMVGKE